MSKIFVTSDLHLGHDREFIWGARGYADVNEMNIKQIEKFNSVVSDEDEGEDKMQKAANREKKSPYDIAAYYTRVFLEDLEKLFEKLNTKNEKLWQSIL